MLPFRHQARALSPPSCIPLSGPSARLFLSGSGPRAPRPAKQDAARGLRMLRWGDARVYVPNQLELGVGGRALASPRRWFSRLKDEAPWK